jgi:hypothetical protein
VQQPREKKMVTAAKFIYIDNTGSDTRGYHAVIVEAAKNGGTFGEDFADIFTLTKCPDGSACEYALNFA